MRREAHPTQSLPVADLYPGLPQAPQSAPGSTGGSPAGGTGGRYFGRPAVAYRRSETPYSQDILEAMAPGPAL